MSVVTLARDRGAPRCALAVFVVLREQALVSPAWARLKLLQVECAAHLPRSTAAKALSWLVRWGYLERRRDPFAGLLYRLPE